MKFGVGYINLDNQPAVTQLLLMLCLYCLENFCLMGYSCNCPLLTIPCANLITDISTIQSNVPKLQAVMLLLTLVRGYLLVVFAAKFFLHQALMLQ